MQTGMTLTELAQEIDRQTHNKRDLVVDGRRALRLERAPITAANEKPELGLTLIGNSGARERVGITDTAHNQLAGRLDIPRKYYDRLREAQPDLLEHNVNTLLEREGKPYLVRMLDRNARAFLSNQYRIIDNGPVLRDVLPAIRASGVQTKMLGSNVHHDRMDLKVLFPGGEFAQQITNRTRSGAMRTVFPGFRLSNSETGLGSVRVEAFFWDDYCDNGCVFGMVEVFTYRRSHIGTKLRLGELDILSQETMDAEAKAIMCAVRDMVGKVSSPEFVRQLGDRLREAAETPQAEHPVAAIDEAVRVLPIRDAEKPSLLETFIKDGDYSQWGLASAVTELANNPKTSWDRVCELESIGSKVLSLKPHEWKRIQRAEPEPVRAAA